MAAGRAPRARRPPPALSACPGCCPGAWHCRQWRRGASRSRAPELLRGEDRLEGAQRRGDCVLTRVVAHGADAPDLAVQRAERRADLDVVLIQQRVAHALAVDA